MRKISTCLAFLLVFCGITRSAANAQSSVVYAVPFTENFDGSIDDYKIVDANEDDFTWTFNAANSAMEVGSSLDIESVDEWILSPGFNLEGGKTYHITANVSKGFEYSSEEIAVYWGESQTVEAMDGNTIIAPSTVDSTIPSDLKGAFTPTQSGTYYFGFHATSDAFYRYVLSLYSYSVTEGDSTSDPNPGSEVLNVPFTENFDGDVSGYTILDENGDGTTWKPATEFGEKVMEVVGERWYELDDWLISPAVNLVGGKKYKISVDVSTFSSYETIEVKLGNEATSAAMTQELIPSFSLNDWDYRTFDGTFEVSTSGEYYIGFHAISDYRHEGLYLKSYTVEEYEEGPEPTVEGIKVPYTENFKNDLRDYLNVDNTNNGVEWDMMMSYIDWDYVPGIEYLPYPYYDSNIDCWLISPAFEFEKNKTYTLTLSVSAKYNGDIEKIAVSYGDKREIGSMTNIIIPATEFDNAYNYVDITGEFTPEESGLYYLGFQACSDKNTHDGLYMKSYSITEKMVYPAPTNLTASENNSNVSISWDAPVLDENPSLSDEHLKGYKVYFALGSADNLAELATKEKSETSHSHANVEEGVINYAVTALYEKDGVSAESAPATLTFIVTSVDNLFNESTVSVKDGFIVINNAEGKKISVSSINGLNIYTNEGAVVNAVKANPGLYIVTVGNTNYKVIVK